MVENKRSLKSYLRDYGFLLVVAGLIIVFDQWTKSLVRANLEFQEVWSPWPWLAPYARIVHWRNTGAVFGIFQGFGDIFTILAIVVAIAIIYYFPQVPREDWPLRVAMCLQLGGAVGNLIDRITIGWVTDFVSVGRFPVFNVADASISVGVAVLIIGVWWKDYRRAPSETPPEKDPSPESVSDALTEETWGE